MSLMVMQSRKCFRLNDGYFDKKSSNHHLEDSMSKYSSKGINSYGNCNDSSYGKHRRNCSPTNGSNSRSRSASPDNWSPNRSVYGNKSSYSRNKERDRDRDRERDKYYESKKKAMNCRSSRSRSPLEPKQSYNKSLNNHSSHDLSSNDTKSANHSNDSKRFGDWSEQKSSSGKKYYYNVKTQVSQWECPKEWLELVERRHSLKSERHSSHSFRNNRNDTKNCVTTSTTSNSKPYVHDLSTYRDKERLDSRTKLSGTASTGSNSNSNSSIRSHSKKDEDLKTLTDRSNHDSSNRQRVQPTETRNVMNCVKRESLKSSPNVSSIESSNTNSNVFNKTNFVNNNASNDVIRTQGISSTNNYNHNNTGCAQQVLNQMLSQQLSPTQTQNLQKLLVSTQGLALSELSLNFSEETLRALQQALQLTVKATDPKNTLSQSSRHRVSSSPRNAAVVVPNSESPVSTSGHHRHHHIPHPHPQQPHHHNQHHSHYHPTSQPHHQSADGIRQELDLLISRGHINKSPVSEKSAISSTRHDSPPSSVTNISSAISSASLKPSVPTLTPSLANFYREDLVSHVTGWQADHSEKQAKVYSIQSHDIGSHQCTRVSAELKMARSLVRLTEIQSTLQEQRILFATQQIKNVEDWKGQNASHSSYHS